MSDFQRFWLDIGQSMGLLFFLSACYYAMAVYRALRANRSATRSCETIGVWEAIEKARYTRPMFWILVAAMVLTLWWASFPASRFTLGLLYALWYMDWSLTQQKKRLGSAQSALNDD